MYSSLKNSDVPPQEDATIDTDLSGIAETVISFAYSAASKGKVHKATSVQRVMYATKSAWWDAKNRFGLPDMMPLDYGAIAHLFAAPADTMMQRSQDAGIPTATT